MSGPVCTYCHTPALVRSCSCGLASYCGKTCQRADWSSHKSSCPSFTVQTIPGKGRGLVATRRLGLGLVVLTEVPVLVLSKLRPNYDKLMADFLNLSKDSQAKILQLQDFLEVSEDLTDTNKLSVKLKRIFEVNSIVSHEDDEEVMKNLYLTASLLNHDCKPNLTWHSVEGRIMVKVLRRVEKGEELTVSYINSVDGTFQRGVGCPPWRQRKERLVKYRFECRCYLCSQEGADDELRKEFQELDLLQEDTEIQGIGELLANAMRKLELARVLDDQAIFLALVDCWKLSQIAAATGQDVTAGQQAAVYREEAGLFASILGQAAVQAFNKFDYVI